MNDKIKESFQKIQELHSLTPRDEKGVNIASLWCVYQDKLYYVGASKNFVIVPMNATLYDHANNGSPTWSVKDFLTCFSFIDNGPRLKRYEGSDLSFEDSVQIINQILERAQPYVNIRLVKVSEKRYVFLPEFGERA